MQTLSLGKHNPKLTELRKSISHSRLTHNGLLPVEGPKLLEEAQRSGLEVLDVFVRGDVSLSSFPIGATIYQLDADTFKTIQSTEHSQGIIGLVRLPTFSLDVILKARTARIVVLARLQDPGNVGAILRISEAFAATACLGLKGTVSVYNAKTVRASAGSVFRLPHFWNLDLQDIVRDLKSVGIRLLGTSPAASASVDQWNWDSPVAVLIGNEGGGLSEAEIKNCDALVRIPQKRAVESLNSAIVTAIILYEASKRDLR